MSYGITPYRVDLSRVYFYFGSNQEGMLQRIGIRFADKISRTDDWFGDAPMAEILKDLFTGQIRHPDLGFLYYYGIEIMILELGTRMSNSEWYPASMEEIWDLPGTTSYLTDTTLEIPFPDDFPMVVCLGNAKLDAAMEAASTVIADPAQRDQLIDWCRQAKANQQDLVLYYY